MGDVVQLPVRREPLHESEQQTARPRRGSPSGAPVPTPGPAPGPTPGRAPHETEPVVEPLWRESVGRELREERLASGKRLVDVAEEAGVSPQYLSEVERGLKDPSSELLAAITGALGLSVAEIATRVASTSISPQSPVCLAA
jgi:DNA-binding XRE family transcriptional regulator